MTLVDFCQRLIQADSTPGKEQAAIQLAAGEMETLGYDEVTVDTYGNLIGRVGSGRRSDPGGRRSHRHHPIGRRAALEPSPAERRDP